MRPRWRKVLSDLWGNRTRSLLVVASIAVGLFAIGVIATQYLVFSDDLRVGYAAANPANIYLATSPIDQDLVDHLARLPGVRQAVGERAFLLRLEGEQGEWITIALKSTRDLGGMPVNQVHPVQGSWPPQDRQIVLERYKLPTTHARLGDRLTLELPSGRTRSLELAGVVQDQTLGAFEGGTGGFFTAPVQGYVTQDTLEWLGQALPDTYNGVYLTVLQGAGDPAQIRQVAERVRRDLEANGVTIASSMVRSSFDHPNATLVDAIMGILFVLGLLIVFLSGFLITNMLQALLDQQIEQVGIMKTVGGRRAQIVGVYVALILVFGLLAFAIAAPLANQAAFQLVRLLSGQINLAYRGVRFLPQVFGLQLVLALLVPLLAGFLPIWQGARLSVQEALSGYRQNAAPRRGRFDRWLAGFRGLSRPMRLSLRNAFRRKGRLLLTLVTLSLGGAVFISTFNVRISLNQYIVLISRYFLADVNLTLARPYRLAEIQQELAGVPGVRRVEGWAAAAGELVRPDGSVGESIQVLAPPAGSSLVSPILLQGRWLQPGDQDAITLNDHFMAQHPQVGLGDTVRLRINGRNTDWRVVGFFQLAGNIGGTLGYANYDALAARTGLMNRAVLFRVAAQDPNLGPAGQAALARTIEAHLRAGGIDLAGIETGSWSGETASKGFATLTAFLLSLAILTALVGSIGLTGTMSLSVMERTREIGVLRAIGATNRILMRMVLVEGLMIGCTSWLVGSLLAFPISKLMSDNLSLSLFGSPSSFGFTPVGFVLWLGVVLLLSFLASIMPARKAARLTIREVLAYE